MCKSKKLSLSGKNIKRNLLTGRLKLQKTGTIKNTFHKEERLCGKKKIETLFLKGSSANIYPVKMMFMPAEPEQPYPVQALFVVPKKSFRKAHDRNKLKRRMKEAYRLSKHIIYDYLGADTKITAAFIFTGKKHEDYAVINKAITGLLEKLKGRKKI